MNGIYQYVQYPEEKTVAANALFNFDSMILPTGIPGTNGQDLKGTQEADGANGNTPRKPLKVQ